MFYYLIPSFLTYNLFLVAAAIIPALFLMGKVYRSDRLEPESPHLLFALARAGVFAALIAILAERVLGAILDADIPKFLVEVGQKVAASGMDFEAWYASNSDTFAEIAQTYID